MFWPIITNQYQRIRIFFCLYFELNCFNRNFREKSLFPQERLKDLNEKELLLFVMIKSQDVPVFNESSIVRGRNRFR